MTSKHETLKRLDQQIWYDSQAMMEHMKLVFQTLFLACSTVLLSGCTSTPQVPPLEGAPPNAPVETIEITARKYAFTPDTIRVKQGTIVRLALRSLDTAHGIKIGRYGIDKDIPKKGKGSVTVEFYARKPGVYDFHCSNICGLGHFGMDGKLIVEE